MNVNTVDVYQLKSIVFNCCGVGVMDVMWDENKKSPNIYKVKLYWTCIKIDVSRNNSIKYVLLLTLFNSLHLVSSNHSKS